VGIEQRKDHESDKDRGTRNGEWHMVEKEATPLVAVRAKRLNRRSWTWSHRDLDAERAARVGSTRQGAELCPVWVHRRW
jgi:hypothetical protein